MNRLIWRLKFELEVEEETRGFGAVLIWSERILGFVFWKWALRIEYVGRKTALP